MIKISKNYTIRRKKKKNTNKKNIKVTKTILSKQKKKYKSLKKGGGVLPSLEDPFNKFSNLNYEDFYNYFNPETFMEKCTKKEDLDNMNITSVLCEKFGLNMLNKVSFILEILKLNPTSNANLTNIQKYAEYLEKGDCNTNRGENRNTQYDSDLKQILNNIYNIENIKKLMSEYDLNTGIETDSSGDALSENDVDAQIKQVSDTITDLISSYYGLNDAKFDSNTAEKCTISRNIVFLTKIISSISKLMESKHGNPELNCNTDDNNYLCRLFNKSLQMLIMYNMYYYKKFIENDSELKPSNFTDFFTEFTENNPSTIDSFQPNKTQNNTLVGGGVTPNPELLKTHNQTFKDKLLYFINTDLGTDANFSKYLNQIKESKCSYENIKINYSELIYTISNDTELAEDDKQKLYELLFFLKLFRCVVDFYYKNSKQTLDKQEKKVYNINKQKLKEETQGYLESYIKNISSTGQDTRLVSDFLNQINDNDFYAIICTFMQELAIIDYNVNPKKKKIDTFKKNWERIHGITFLTTAISALTFALTTTTVTSTTLAGVTTTTTVFGLGLAGGIITATTLGIGFILCIAALICLGYVYNKKKKKLKLQLEKMQDCFTNFVKNIKLKLYIYGYEPISNSIFNDDIIGWQKVYEYAKYLDPTKNKIVNPTTNLAKQVITFEYAKSDEESDAKSDAKSDSNTNNYINKKIKVKYTSTDHKVKTPKPSEISILFSYEPQVKNAIESEN